jgi:Kef-type K+ transport system membrane component KefB
VPRGVFVLFISVSMCVTAFPVLARILADRGMTHTWLGTLSLASAAVADVAAWCLLALVIGFVRATDNPIAVVLTTLTFVALMLFLVRPAVARLVARLDRDALSEPSIAFALLAMLISALITEAAGIHAIFGAFLMGVVIPHHSQTARNLLGAKTVLAALLLPAYFAYAGLRTDVGLVSGSADWLFCALIILVASAGKFAGAMIAAPIAKLSLRQATAFGALMNARGLMELIVLNIGLDVGVITPRLYTLLVIMAVTTTLLSSPVIRLLLGTRPAEALTPRVQLQ